MQHRSAFVFAIALGLSVAGISTAAAQNGNGVLKRADGIYLRCDRCGTVEDIQHHITQGGGNTTAGTVVGAIAGGLLGNQIGRGKGNTLATIGGVAGGAAAGNAISKGGTKYTAVVRVRLGNGSTMNIEVPDANALRVGDLVEVEPNGSITRIQ